MFYFYMPSFHRNGHSNKKSIVQCFDYSEIGQVFNCEKLKEIAKNIDPRAFIAIENVYEVEFERYANDSDLSDLVCELGSVPEIWGQNNNTPLIYVGGINIKPSEIRVMGRN